MKAQRGQAFGGVAQDVRFTLGAQQGQGEASGEDATRRPEPSSRNEVGSFQERYQTAVDQALAALAAVNALPIGQRFAANTPKANNDVFDVQFTKKFDYACRVLGVDRNAASDALHAAKNALGLRANQNCEFNLKTGDILWQGEVIGNLFDN